MKKSKVEFRFVARNYNDVALQLIGIFKNIAYTELDKNKIAQLCNLEIGKELHQNEIIKSIEETNQAQGVKIDTIIAELELFWNENKHGLLSCIYELLDINIPSSECYDICCQLHMLPFNEIDYDNKSIHLNYNQDINLVIKDFVIMLVKSLLLFKLETLIGRGNFSYNPKNRIWMVIEIAIDALFVNSELIKWSERPSYSYFYNLIINNVNVMEKFRKLYKLIKIEDFLANIYAFVRDNYDVLIKFKNYLY